jgi:hypothetical protein
VQFEETELGEKEIGHVEKPKSKYELGLLGKGDAAGRRIDQHFDDHLWTSQ